MASITTCSKILFTIASPAFKMAYEKGVSIWEARNELNKLKVTIETIQAMLKDAESKQEGSEAVKKWIQRLKEVLYDAEDFFDEVLTEDLLKQQMMEGNNKLSLKNKVRVSCSKLNPIVSRNSIEQKVKVIRGRLAEISNDMAQLEFGQSQPKEPIINISKAKNIAWCTMGENSIIGRDDEKNAILEMLISQSPDPAISDSPVVISIDGIGGMGKTTLAYLIYNHVEVEKIFKMNRWFACISNISNEKQLLEKIYQPMCESGIYNGLTEIQLVDKIRDSIKGKKYLLVLDDVWEDDHGKWKSIKSLLSSGGNGSMIIATTRLQSVVRAMGAVRAHNLGGLSEEDSWNLFKTLAFDSPYENDPRRENVGRKLLERCRGVPLAIWCMGNLLHDKTIQEWEEIERIDLPTVGGDYNGEIMSILKLSYDHLPPNLKQCFTYCCLYPQDYRYNKKELIYHWIAQGYTNLDEGESSFMHLLSMGFFQEVEEDEFGEIESCKMHDIMHDLALHLGGEESFMLSDTSSNTTSCTRHVSLMVDYQDIPTWLLNAKSLRSYLMLNEFSFLCGQTSLDQLCSNFTLLRTLTLSRGGIQYIPPSLGELKLLKYLDLSCNIFEELPDSITNLVNLLILNIQWCTKLKVWPRNFKKLINLCSLNFRDSDKLRSMPEGIGEMGGLRYLSDFMLEKGSELDVLNGLLKQLRGDLSINFSGEMEVEDEWRWQLPADVSLQHLLISDYPGKRIRGWGNNESTSKLEHLELKSCKNVKHLPPLSCLPILKYLGLENFLELEFMEEEEVNTHNHSTSNNLFFPCLEEIVLDDLPKLKGLSTSVVSLEFSHLSKLHIRSCPNLELNSVPLCPQLRELLLDYVGDNTSTILCPSTYQSLQKLTIFSCNWLSSIPGEALTSLQELYIRLCCNLKSLHVPSHHLQRVRLYSCKGLKSVEVEAPTHIDIHYCSTLKNLRIANPIALQDMEITECPELALSTCVDWESLTNLNHLELRPPLEELPQCLLQRQARGELRFS